MTRFLFDLREREGLVECLRALHAIQDHATDVDCDRECVEWMQGLATKALDALLGGSDWVYADFERVVVALREEPPNGS